MFGSLSLLVVLQLKSSICALIGTQLSVGQGTSIERCLKSSQGQTNKYFFKKSNSYFATPSIFIQHCSVLTEKNVKVLYQRQVYIDMPAHEDIYFSLKVVKYSSWLIKEPKRKLDLILVTQSLIIFKGLVIRGILPYKTPLSTQRNLKHKLLQKCFSEAHTD